jgi:hypothetical protein
MKDIWEFLQDVEILRYESIIDAKSSKVTQVTCTFRVKNNVSEGS